MEKKEKVVPYYMQVIKETRKKDKISVKDVQEYLEQHGQSVSHKTIYGWESGSAAPNVDSFLLMCSCLGISDLSILFPPEFHERDLELTTKEQKIIKNYRQKSDIQMAVDILLGVKPLDDM